MKRYALQWLDMSRLQTRSFWSGSVLKLTVSLLALLAVVVALAVGIIMLTPLHTLLPGYMKEEQRQATLAANLRLDSLQTLCDRNEAYLASIAAVLDPGRTPTDSIDCLRRGAAFTADSLPAASQREREFMQQIEKRSKNALTFSPGGQRSDGVALRPVHPGAIVTPTGVGGAAEVRVPANGVVGAVAEGKVLDVYSCSAGGGYVVVIQHADGYISRYSRIESPLVKKREFVAGSQALCLSRGEPILLEIWLNGDPVDPSSPLFGSGAKNQ